nr:immunoglobulin heavy chain junction region [Macaca mulatta]
CTRDRDCRGGVCYVDSIGAGHLVDYW